MKFISSKFMTLIILALTLLLSACVGTIEDASKKETSSNNLKVSPAEFEGIAQAVAISHNKADVAFKPAVGGSGDFSYLVYLNGNFDRSVAAIDNSLLKIDSNDMAHIIVSDLSIGTSYSFSVRVYDKVSAQTDTNRIALSATTLSYEVPNFEGIKSLENAKGKLGDSSLVVSWNKATSGAATSSGFGDDVNAVSGYNIYFGTSPTDLSNVVPVNGADTTTYTLSGLMEGTEYYVRVRARNSNNPNQEEENTLSLTKKTTTSQLLSFGGVGNLSIPVDRSGYHYINVNWTPGSGNFDSYKIFMDTSPTPFQKDFFEWKESDFEVVKKITDTNTISKSLYVAKSNTPYYIAVVACGSGIFGECTSNMGYTSVKSITPTPPVVPFAGIKEIGGIEAVSGLNGLTSVNLYWDAPNPTLGVFKRIEVYDCGDTNFIPRTTTLNDLYSPDVSLRVTGLQTGKQYCFVALAVEDVDSPTPRRSVTMTPRYVTPSFVPPILNGLTSCYQVNSKGFKVNWPQATVSTMLSNYEVFIKQKTSNGSFNWTNAINANNQALTTTDFNNDSSKYLVNYLSTTTFNYTFTDLLPGTTYQLGVRTYLSNGANEYRSNPSMILECTTDNISAVHQGWLDVFAIGPKYDGIDKGVVKERLAAAGETSVLAAYKHLFPIEDSTVALKVNGSDQGIIRINWYDFKLSNGDSVVSNPNAGYKIYRKTHSVLYNNYMPAFTESVDNDPTWQLVSGENLIRPKTDTLVDGKVKSFGQFIDYTATHPADLKEGQIYYYRVELFISDKHIEYGAASVQAATKDIILRVVLPPKNMAFMHRWMANKQLCEEMKKTPDRDNNYRCNYDGLGSVYDSSEGKYFYDMKGDVFTDRFMLACPFSRGDTDYTCSEVSTNSYPNFEGRAADDTRGIKLGDCIGVSGTPNLKITAKKGSIFFDRSAPTGETCYINTSTTGSGSDWKSLDDIDSIARGYASQSTDYFAKNNAGNRSRISTKIPPDGSNFPSGEGWGLFINSNDAGLPQLVTSSNGLNWTCQSGSFSVNNKTYLKRLMRRKEQIASFAMSPLLESFNQSLSGKTEIKIAAGTANPWVDYRYNPLSATSVDRDCNVNSNGGGTVMYKSPTMSYGTLNLKKPTALNGWLGRLYGSSNNFFSWFANGSSGAISTDACVTRFGLQDYVGQGNEALSDVLYCKKSTKFCSFNSKDLAGTSSYTPPWDETNKENWKNALGYTSFSSNNLGNNPDRLGSPLLFTETYPYGTLFSSSPLYYPTGASSGVDVLDVSQIVDTGTASNPNKQTKSGMKYFSLAMGMPLICEGKGCNYGTSGSPQYTDDTKFSLQAGRPTSETTQLSSDYQEWMKAQNLSSGYLSDEFLLTLSTGHPSWTNSNMQPDTAGKNRRFFLIYDPLPPKSRGRCSQLVESY